MFRATGVIRGRLLWPDESWGDEVLDAIRGAVNGTGPVARIGMVRRHNPEVYNRRNMGGVCPFGFLIQADLIATVNRLAWEAQVLLGTLEEVAAIMGVGPYAMTQGLGASGLVLTTDGTVRCKWKFATPVSKPGRFYGRLAYSFLLSDLDRKWKTAWEKAQAHQTRGE
jgi:hypothetical protein